MAAALNAKQSKFVERVIATGDQIGSYMEVYGTSNRDSARAASARLLANVTVANAIERGRTQAVAKAIEVRQVTVEMALSNLWVQATADGEGTSHVARVMASRALLEHFREAAMGKEPPPPAGTTNVNVTVVARIDQFAAAFAGAAARELGGAEAGAVPGDGAGEPVDPGVGQGRTLPEAGGVPLLRGA